jgi:hypothetical protein
VLLDDLDQVDLGLYFGEGVVGRWGGHSSIVGRSVPAKGAYS